MVSRECCLMAMAVFTANNDNIITSEIKRAVPNILGPKLTCMMEKAKPY